MSFFDRIGETITSTGKGVAQKAKDVSSSSRYQSLIRDCEQKEKDLYLQIGKAYYEETKSSPSEAFSNLFAALDQIVCEKTVYNEQLVALKKQKVCPKCGAQMAADAMFCMVCGARYETAPAQMPVQAPVQAPDQMPPEQDLNAGKVCPSCGSPIADDDMFCTKCGMRIV